MAEHVMRAQVRQAAQEVKGFLEESEGERLFELAQEVARQAPCLEIGSYCGRSTLYLAEGCRLAGGHPVISVDHHRGSEEQQAGEAYFDETLVDDELGQIDTLCCFRRTLAHAGLEQWVIPVITSSLRFGQYWRCQPLGLLFIDGGHSEVDAFGDFHTWSRHIMTGGYLCLHDVFEDPGLGGQAPYHVLAHALAGGQWALVDQVQSLATLRRVVYEQKPEPGGRRLFAQVFGKFSRRS